MTEVQKSSVIYEDNQGAISSKEQASRYFKNVLIFAIILCETWQKTRILITSIFRVKITLRASWQITPRKQILQGIWKESQRENFENLWILEGIMLRIIDSQMTSSPVTRLNIPVTHSLKSWMWKTGMGGYWSQDPGLVSDYFTSIGKGNNRIKIITNVVLSGGWGVSVCWTRSRSDSIYLKLETWKTIIIKVGQAHQVFIVFLVNSKIGKYYHVWKGYFNIPPCRTWN